MDLLIFNATKEQIQLAGALAADAASPVGMGIMQYQADHDFTAKEMKQFWSDREFHIDYAQGRCVKMRVWPADERFYKDTDGYEWMTGYPTRSDYETWNGKYPTYEDLLRAAGITDIKRYIDK